MPDAIQLGSSTVPSGSNDLAGGVQQKHQIRPEVPQRIQAQVRQWWTNCDAMVQRANALWETREAHKFLFPARFNLDDPRRGQTPFELRNGKDDRRVQVPYLFRDGLQTTAMAVPEDLGFEWVPQEQVKAPQNPMLAMLPTMAAQGGMSGVPPVTALGPPQSEQTDPNIDAFGQTMRIVQTKLLDEIVWLKTVQAWVQDAGYFPCAVLKFSFWRDYRSSPLSETPQNKDQSDSIARMEGLMSQFANGDFNQDSNKYADLLSLVSSLQNDAELRRWYGWDFQLVSMDAFGISEDASDLVSIYDAPYMWHDILITGEELLAKAPYRLLSDGTSDGILPDELGKAQPWDQRSATTDPHARNKITRNRQLTMPRSTPTNVVSPQGTTADPKQMKYMVREIWCKKDRTVRWILRGVDHYLKQWIPQNTSQRWYPFAVLAPNRVPTEVYGASDLELKKDIQKRIHRKRSDEEKARWLSIRRYVYNKALVDEKEMAKVQDIPPAQFRGLNLPAGSKIQDVVMPLEQPFDPRSFDTSADERDKDMMGALPSQAMGATGMANFATEANIAAQGASIAIQFRQATIRREIEGMLLCMGEILLQEMTPDEVRDLAGPYALWPEIYDDAEAAQAKKTAKDAARQLVLPQVIQGEMLEARQLAMATGMPAAQPDPREIMSKVDSLAAPIWQSELIQKYGAAEPLTRESLFCRLKIKVKSSLTSSLDRQQRIQSLSLLAQSTMQLAQAAQMAAIPFDPRAFLEIGAKMVGEGDKLERIFPATNPLQALPAPIAGHMPQGQPPAPGSPGRQSPHNQGNAPQNGPETKAAAGSSPGPG